MVWISSEEKQSAEQVLPLRDSASCAFGRLSEYEVTRDALEAIGAMLSFCRS